MRMEKAGWICLLSKGNCDSWQTYWNLGNRWEVTYGAAGLEICPSCGRVGSHYEIETDAYSCGFPETVNKKELEKRILAHIRKRLQIGESAEIQWGRERKSEAGSGKAAWVRHYKGAV